MKTIYLAIIILLFPLALISQVKAELKIDAFNLIYKDPHISLEIMPSKFVGFELGAKYNFDEISIDTTGVIATSNENLSVFKHQSFSGMAAVKFYPSPRNFANRFFFGFYFHQEIETKSAEQYESIYFQKFGNESDLGESRSAVGALLGYKWIPNSKKNSKRKLFIEAALNMDWNIKSFSDDNKTSTDNLALLFLKFGKRF